MFLSTIWMPHLGLEVLVSGGEFRPYWFHHNLAGQVSGADIKSDVIWHVRSASFSAERPGVEFEYASPLIRVQKHIEAAGLRKTIEEPGLISQLNPAVHEHLDANRFVRDTADANGLPSTWLVSGEDVVRNREARAGPVVAMKGVFAFRRRRRRQTRRC